MTGLARRADPPRAGARADGGAGRRHPTSRTSGVARPASARRDGDTDLDLLAAADALEVHIDMDMDTHTDLEHSLPTPTLSSTHTRAVIA
ncbi:hypothetical protein ACLI4Y_13865 [Natrialbaceae archaeon A-CW3]